MESLSFTEENYLKAIFHLAHEKEDPVATNAIAEAMETKAASVTDMLKKLADKKLISYKKYYGVHLSPAGERTALMIIRKHRLWEVFLVKKLQFNWDQVHDVAEQLEHITSPLLIERLDAFLGYPRVDPHGDPIPDENGELIQKQQFPLTEYPLHTDGYLVAVKNSDAPFLQFLNKMGLQLGTRLQVMERMAFDGSHELKIEGDKEIFISREVADNILIAER